MGGVVTRAFILKYRFVIPKIRLLYFFATPTTGSPYAKLANIFSSNTQFKQLYPIDDPDSYLAPQQSNWLAAGLKLRSYCAYETQPLFGQIIVPRESATNLCTERLDPIDADHITIVKPTGTTSTPYRALKSAFIETQPRKQASTPTRKKTARIMRSSVSPSVSPSVKAEDIDTIQSGTIIAAHYPTGELFAVDPKTATLRLLSARLPDVRGLLIRKNGEVIVLVNYSEVGSSELLAVNLRTGYHREIRNYFRTEHPLQCLAEDSDDSIIVAHDSILERVDLTTGNTKSVANNNLLRSMLGIVRIPSGEIIATIVPDKVVKINPADGTVTILVQSGSLWYPKAPTVENRHSILVGASTPDRRRQEGVFRINLDDGTVHLVATGPFKSITGLAIEDDGEIIVADNGEGAPGNGFLARLDPQSQQVSIFVSAPTTNWKFMNGRSVAILHGQVVR
jgi:hypothetical protein